MALQIDFIDEMSQLSETDAQFIQRLLETAAKVEGVEEAELSISFVDNETIREINREYRGKDMPTDVISFAMEETVDEDDATVLIEGMPRMLGDLIISIPRAKEQAEDYGHSFERELGFLAVHGFLHLLGYDHMTEEEEKEMFTKQEEVLNEFGLARE